MKINAGGQKVDSQTSSKAFLDIFEYFQYVRQPSNSQMSQWHEKVKFIPLVAVDWIVSQITNGDKMPRNLPKAFVAQWYAYRKAHKDKSVGEQLEYCDDCYGHGTHMFKKLDHNYNPPMWISYIAMCSKCDNWQKHFGSVCRNGGRIYIENKPIGGYVPKVPAVTRQEIIDLGFEYQGQDNPMEERIKTFDINKLTASAVRGV